MKINLWTNTLKPLALALLLAGCSSAALAQTATPPTSADAVLQKLEAMHAEIAKLKAELNALKAAQQTTQATGEQTKQFVSELAARPMSEGFKPVLDTSEPATVLTGYGEMNYNRPTRQQNDTQLDLRRVVLGVEHRFDEKTKFVGEFEWEHAVTSAGDQGEAAVEQAYIEHALTDKLSLKAGLMLMPFGLLNEHHEPSAYYGVERNAVETAIIPTTWREGGLMLVGTSEAGLSWSAGVVTGFDLNKWDSTKTNGKVSPLGSIHQEGQMAKAKNVSLITSLEWRGTPGLLVGASHFTGQAGHGQIAGNVNPTVTIWDVHARLTLGRWDVSALHAQGSISNAAELNTALLGNTSLIPAKFGGTYVQAGYNLWTSGSYQVKPFARKEWLNTGKRFEAVGANLAPDASVAMTTVGANFHISRHVVFKGDYQRYTVNPDRNRVNLGVGWSF
jgi:phosphate-selective porin